MAEVSFAAQKKNEEKNVSATKAPVKPKPKFKWTQKDISRAIAIQAKRKEIDEKRASNQFLSERAGKKMVKAQEFLNNKQYDEAYAVYDKMLTKAKKGSYEYAFVLQSIGYANLGQDKFKTARSYLIRSAEHDVFISKVKQTIQLTIGQLFLTEEDGKNAIPWLQKWYNFEPYPKPAYRVMFASAYLQTEDYTTGLPLVRKAIDVSPKPKESWYQLMLAMHFERKDYRAAVTLLHEIIDIFPDKPKYWSQLSALYMEVKDEKKSLAAAELAYAKGFMTKEKEIVRLVSLLLYQETPYRAARILDKGIKDKIVKPSQKNLETLANSWHAAQESQRSIIALKKAAALSKTGKLYLRLGQLLIEDEQWVPAVEALELALEKGVKEKKKEADIYYLMGVSATEANLKVKARLALNKARKYKRYKSTARQWLRMLDQKK